MKYLAVTTQPSYSLQSFTQDKALYFTQSDQWHV